MRKTAVQPFKGHEHEQSEVIRYPDAYRSEFWKIPCSELRKIPEHKKTRFPAVRILSGLFLAVITLALVSINAGAAESGDSSTDTVKKPEKCYELVTGGNEEYYSKITINSRSVLISG